LAGGAAFVGFVFFAKSPRNGGARGRRAAGRAVRLGAGVKTVAWSPSIPTTPWSTG
jgi:phosphoribosylanthranilate isomerase